MIETGQQSVTAGPGTPNSVSRQREFETTGEVADKRVVADGVVELVLRRADGHLWPAWSAGAHVDVILDEHTVRQYSLSGPCGDRVSWRLGVLREPAGRGGSERIHDQLSRGDQVRIRGPRNHFSLHDDGSFVFMAGGIGITPILPMIEEVERRGTPWVLHYGGRTRSSMAFVAELTRYGDKVVLYPQDEVGLPPLAEILGRPSTGTGIYACGPERMLEAVEAAGSGWPKGRIHTERFAAVPEPEPVANGPIEVYLAESDLTVQVGSEESILQAVRAVGIEVLSSCREGICGTCETPVLQGEPDHRDSVLDDEEKAENASMMICVSRALSRRLVLDL